MDIPVESIKSLVELMVENDLSRIELREGESLILLRRGQPVVAGATIATAAPISLAPAPAAPPAASQSGAATAVVGAAVATEGEVYIRSPMVGTFYASPDPESPAFIGVGDNVRPDSVVCLVEAMKVFNEIKAETSGRITKILAKNAQAVEFDQPLFAVVPA